MNRPKHLHTIFHERQGYLLDQLRVIDTAIRNAQQNEEAIDWMERMGRWRADLQDLVERMPEP